MQGHKTSSSFTFNFVFQNKEIEMELKNRFSKTDHQITDRIWLNIGTMNDW